MAKTWHTLSTNQILEVLSVDRSAGLSSAEVIRRRQEVGPNELMQRKGSGALLRFLLQFNQPLIFILLGATLISVLLGEYTDSIVIFGVVLINSIIGFLQESKALNALAALAKTMKTTAVVLRDGKKHHISAEHLVPGDIVLMQSGDKVPADLRLLQSRDLQVDESTLTGESVPVSKNAAVIVDEVAALADRKNMCFASTLVTFGQGNGVVVATADTTEIGRISELLATTEQLQTPLTLKIESFSKLLLWVILALAGLTFLIGVLRDESFLQMFMVSIALAVSAIPEGLPAAVTITLAVGVSRMAKRHAIIRKLPAVETLGSTTIICSDKTGTLTQNQMTVVEVHAGGEWFNVEGVGYEPKGGFSKNGQTAEASKYPALIDCLRAGLLCNESQLLKKDGEWKINGDPTEGSLLVSAAKAGFDPVELHRTFPRMDVIPFESQHQYMATIHKIENQNRNVVYLKGAVEVIVERCSSFLDNAGNEVPINQSDVLTEAEQRARRGIRVLAFAKHSLENDISRISHNDVRKDLVFLGLQGMIDPARPEAISAIRECKQAGIRVKMITGDHALTAETIANNIGIRGDEEKPYSISGTELAQINDSELSDVVEKTDVFARVSPEQKLRLVTALQSRGDIVAMTGDGVNDGPALRRANIGVAMGITGTEVAKEAADMVLTDDNFATIVAAVEEGRGVFANLTKFIVWTLPTNGGEAAVVFVSILLGTTLPIQPVQILWINMTTAVFLGMMLAFEPREADIMDKPPRNSSQPILTSALIKRIVIVSILLMLGTLGLFKYELQNGSNDAYARTVASNVLVMGELFYLFNCRSLAKSVFAVGFFSNKLLWLGIFLMIIAQLFFTYLPIMNRLFGTTAISFSSWINVIIVAFLVFVIVGIEKQWANRRKKGILG